MVFTFEIMLLLETISSAVAVLWHLYGTCKHTLFGTGFELSNAF